MLGFTLIEMLMAMALIAFLALLSITSMSSFISKNEHQVISDDLKACINYAKNQAINLGTPVRLNPLDTVYDDWSNGATLTRFNKKTKQRETLREWVWHHPQWQLQWSGMHSSKHINLSNNPARAISNGRFTLRQVQTKKEWVYLLNRLGRLRAGELAS